MHSVFRLISILGLLASASAQAGSFSEDAARYLASGTLMRELAEDSTALRQDAHSCGIQPQRVMLQFHLVEDLAFDSMRRPSAGRGFFQFEEEACSRYRVRNVFFAIRPGDQNLRIELPDGWGATTLNQFQRALDATRSRATTAVPEAP